MTRRLLAVLVCSLALPAGAHASSTMESTFQDDNLLVYNSPEGTAQTLDTLKGLGVDRIRASVFWSIVAPDAGSKQRPQFDAADPAAYPAAHWERYDRLLRLAAERGIAVNLNPTSPAPLWATGSPGRQDIEATYTPSPQEFGQFVRALGTRYSGSYVPPAAPGGGGGGGDGGGGGEPVLPPITPPTPPRAQATQASGDPLPRVSYWTIWNEPNQAGWLTPQWRQVEGRWVESSPALYRGLVDAAWSALHESGHGGDAILVGETAPKGLGNHRGETRSIDALRFVRRLYCLDDRLRVLHGKAAEAHGCPTSDGARTFAAQHPALFRMTGWAHHPYELTFSPSRRPTSRDWVTIANLGDLSGLLRRVRARYGQAARGMPLYLTEFGYQTSPPDPLGVSWARQAAYLNHAEWIAYRNPSVRTFGQFLLVDDKPRGEGSAVQRYGASFQTGLMTENGRRKPALRAYRFPVHVTRRRGRTVSVWGLPRPAADGSRPRVQVQFRRRGSGRWRTLATRRGNRAKGYVNARVRVPGTGALRLRSGAITSRSVAVRTR